MSPETAQVVIRIVDVPSVILIHLQSGRQGNPFQGDAFVECVLTDPGHGQGQGNGMQPGTAGQGVISQLFQADGEGDGFQGFAADGTFSDVLHACRDVKVFFCPPGGIVKQRFSVFGIEHAVHGFVQRVILRHLS